MLRHGAALHKACGRLFFCLIESVPYKAKSLWGVAECRWHSFSSGRSETQSAFLAQGIWLPKQPRCGARARLAGRFVMLCHAGSIDRRGIVCENKFCKKEFARKYIYNVFPGTRYDMIDKRKRQQGADVCPGTTIICKKNLKFFIFSIISTAKRAIFD